MNDQCRFRQLVAEQQFLLEAFVGALTHGRGGSEMVDELVQETIVIALRRFGQYDPERPFGPWIRGIAAKVACAHFRREARRARIRVGGGVMEREYTAALARRFDAIDPPRANQRSEIAVALLDCVQGLERDAAAAVRLHYWAGLKVADMAAILGLDAHAMHKRMQRARARLARCLEYKGFAIESDVSGGAEGAS